MGSYSKRKNGATKTSIIKHIRDKYKLVNKARLKLYVESALKHLVKVGELVSTVSGKSNVVGYFKQRAESASSPTAKKKKLTKIKTKVKEIVQSKGIMSLIKAKDVETAVDAFIDKKATKPKHKSFSTKAMCSKGKIEKGLKKVNSKNSTDVKAYKKSSASQTTSKSSSKDQKNMRQKKAMTSSESVTAVKDSVIMKQKNRSSNVMTKIVKFKK